MNAETEKQPGMDINKVKNKLLQQKLEIARLEKETQALRKELQAALTKDKTELTKDKTERHHIANESQVAIENAERIKNFNQKNYAPSLQNLFEMPSKKIRNVAIIALLFSITAAVTVGYFSASYLNNTHSLVVDKKMDSSLLEQKKLQASIDHQKITLSEKIKSEYNSKQQLISQQAKSILDYVNEAKQQQDFFANYINDKTQFVQLYLRVMSYANNNVYYESYLQAIKELGVSDAIAPKTVEDLLQIDIDFLHAAYSGWAITTLKRARGWRYRKEDRYFSSFYNPEIAYDLGALQLVNESTDYKTLLEIFSLNMERIAQQVIFNGKEDSLDIPQYIYYLAYTEESKNKVVENLFDQKNIKKINGKLKIDTSAIKLPLIYFLNSLLTKTHG